MQLNKASKKTRNIAEETKASAPEKNAAAEVTANPRSTRSSKTKKTETTETGPVKHHHNKSNSATSPDATPAQRTNGKAVAAAGAGSVILDPVGEVAQEEIAELAYSYWIARGHSHGGAEEDWLRAERELGQRR
jgi:hypothetical protein